MNFFHSIKFRFTLWYLLVLALILVLLCAGIYFLLSQILFGNLDSSLEKDALEMNRSRTLYEDVTRNDSKQPRRDLVMLCYYSGDELVKIPDKNRYSLDDETIKKVITSKRIFFTANSLEGDKLRCFGMRISAENENSIQRIQPHGSEKKPVVLIEGRPIYQIEETLNWLLIVFVISIPACLAIAGGGGIFLAKRVLKPVDTITNTALEIEESDLKRRIDIKSKDELGKLALTFNQMIDRLEKAFERQKQFTGDASHELRAPLAIIQAESTLALQKERNSTEYKKSLEIITLEVEHMAKIIDQLLTLARFDAGKDPIVIESVDLSELIRDLLSDIEILCKEKGLSLELNLDDYVKVNGDKVKLRMLFLNILDNAIRYTPQGGTISVELSPDVKAASVKVKDTGIGISREHIEHIFDRFYRVDKARSRAAGGSGLGLAISRQIVEAHGGEISVESHLGKGSVFIIKLPLISL